MAEEKQFEQKVKKFLKSKGAWILKTWGGGFQRSGIPDLLCCYNGNFMAIELKAENGKLSQLQKFELDKIQKAGGVAIVLRPSDFEEFKELLKVL